MINLKNKSITNNTVEKHSPTQSMTAEKHHEQVLETALDATRYAFHVLKENAGDYKAISTDKDLSSVDKAIGKRKVLAADITISFCSIGAFLVLAWGAKKILLA